MSSETSPLLPSSSNTSLSRHELSAWIIDETLRGLPVSHANSIPRTRKNRAAYLFFQNTLFIRQLSSVILVFLTFFELPSYCSPYQKCQAPDNSDLFLSSLPYLSSVTQAVLNFSLIAVLVFFVFYDAIKLPGIHFQPDNFYLKLVLGALALDAVWVLSWGGYPPIRFAPYFRAILPLFYWSALRECTISIQAVVPPFLEASTIVTLFVLLFGWIVTLVFHEVPEADRYFGNLTVGLYSAFTSVTTADWPMQIMAVLDVSRSSALLFLAFIVLGVFLLFNILLAVVYNAYTGHIEELVVQKLDKRRESIGIAYDILVEDSASCTVDDIRTLFQELSKNKSFTQIDENRVDFIFTALDDDADDNLSKTEFLDIVDVLQLKFIVELEDFSFVQKHAPSLYQTSFWQGLSSYVRSPAFTTHINVIMLMNIAFVIFESTMDLRNADTPGSVEFFAIVETIFSFIYIIEMIVKVLSQGFDQYWRDMGNRFDFLVTWLLLFGAIYVLYPYSDNDPEIVRYLVLLRCLRLFSILSDIPRFRRIVQVFSMLIPASAPLFSFFFLSLYVFAAAGVELFGGLIYAGNPALNPENNMLVDAYVSNDYWALNFNDVAAGWYTLFSAVIVGYLTEIAEAIASASKWGDWTKWFFLASFIVNSLIVSNCVIAFVVDLFVMEDEQDDDPIQIELQSRYGAKRVKILQAKNTATQVYITMFKQRVEELFTENPNDAEA